MDRQRNNKIESTFRFALKGLEVEISLKTILLTAVVLAILSWAAGTFNAGSVGNDSSASVKQSRGEDGQK